MRVAIIGGGVSGLVTARVLREFGHEVVLHEKMADLGGVWSVRRRYPGISTQDDRTTYAFSDFPMPRDFPEHPGGAQVRAYLEAYAEEHGLGESIRLSSEVTGMERFGDSWRVASRDASGEHTDMADFVVVANGVFSDAHVPDWPGRAEFEAAGGAVLLPSELEDGDRLRARDVVVVGWGKTACDVAAAASTMARTTSIVVRVLRWKHPKRLGRVLTFRHLLMTRVGEHLLAPQHRSRVGRMIARLDRPLRDAVDRHLARRVAQQLRLDELALRPNGPYSDSSALVSEGFYEAVEQGRLEVRRETVVVALGISSGRPVVRLSDGVELPADVLVPATGYEQRLDALGEQVRQDLLEADGTLRLHRGILPRLPGLAFIGWSHTFHSPLRSELQALWLAHHLESGARPAEPGDLLYHLTHASAARSGAQQLPGATFGDLDLLLEDVRLPAPLSLRLRQLVRPIDPSDYAWILPRLLERPRSSRPASSPVGEPRESLDV